MREWRNRQTRTVQVRVLERVWGFNSPLAHHNLGDPPARPGLGDENRAVRVHMGTELRGDAHPGPGCAIGDSWAAGRRELTDRHRVQRGRQHGAHQRTQRISGRGCGTHGLLHGAHGPPPGRQVRRRRSTGRGGLAEHVDRRLQRVGGFGRAGPGAPGRAPGRLREHLVERPSRHQRVGNRLGPGREHAELGGIESRVRRGRQVWALIADAPHGGLGGQLVHPGQVEVGDVVDGRPSVRGVPGRPVELHLQQHALGSRFARDLAQPAHRVLPHRDDPAGRPSPRLGAERHAERGQGQHRRSRVVGEHAGVAGGPPGRELRPVEQEGHHQGGADRADQLGHTVEPGQVLADHGRDGDAAAEFEEVDAPLGDVHRLPPADARDAARRRCCRPRSGRRPGTSGGACSAGSATSARPAAGRCARRCRGTGPARPDPGRSPQTSIGTPAARAAGPRAARSAPRRGSPRAARRRRRRRPLRGPRRAAGRPGPGRAARRARS